ncbi:FecR family protein [Candidatus Aminicenantes bacterium AC-335-A11]|nr:FecR family protein [SCandidatus Aminicenantes bacterium Aminicenantia_JdfR_composite]MCP2606319.1 FecR family protein [Candidatus Aminicenantes bacterium AC-708-I09]MCP2617976.1 FecR family protein [Candidatus Aminicenantes bacterium AC-335-A11]
MRKIKLIMAITGFFLFTILFISISPLSAKYGHYTFARLSYVKGDVYIQRAADLGYEEGIVNMPISEGDRLGTTDGQAEVYLGKGNYLRLDKYTKVDFLNLPSRGYDFLAFNIWSGSIYLSVKYLERERNFEIKTPDATFYILEEGLYRINVHEAKETELYVIDGLVEAVSQTDSLLVRSEQEIKLLNGEFVSGPRYFTFYARDDFDRWNQYRESEINRRFTNRYLPEELAEYAWELENYGRWIYYRPYGYVWVPIAVGIDWRPYFYGRWVWLPLCGWTWVPYEPWGWLVFHYGRWHWSATIGWYWIPTTVWGPAWVYWYRGIDYIGWCPLSYYGYPVVIINNYCYVREYYNTVPINSRALVFIHKNQLRARNISKVALSYNEVSRTIKLSKISVSKMQPAIRPVENRIQKIQINGKRVLLKKNISLREFEGTRRIETKKIERVNPTYKNYSLSKSKIINRHSRYPTEEKSRERKIIRRKDNIRDKTSTKTERYSLPRSKVIKRDDYRKDYNRYQIYRYKSPSKIIKRDKNYSSSKSRSFLNNLYNYFTRSKTISSSKRSYSSYRNKSSISRSRSYSSSRTISRSTSRSSSSRSGSRIIKKKK